MKPAGKTVFRRSGCKPRRTISNRTCPCAEGRRGFASVSTERRRGFATVYILMILGTLVMAVVIIVTAAAGYASRSAIDSVCASAGRSVLSEYQKELCSRYGIFAVRGDDALLERLCSLYIESSLNVKKAVVHPHPETISATAEPFPALDVKSFGAQVRKLAPAALLTKGRLMETLSGMIGADTAEGSGDSEIITDVEKFAEEEFSRSSDGKGVSISSALYKSLPSRLLGYPKRISLLLSGGIADISLNAISEDEYILALCSNAVHGREDSYLNYETEYILFGNSSDKANLKSLKISLFLLRFAIDEFKYVSDTGEPYSATAAALIKAVTDVKAILAGGQVDRLDYDMYLRILLALIPREEKLARLMDVMQLNIRVKDEKNFSFANYAYGFELNAVFRYRGRTGRVERSFEYQ